MKVSEAKKLMLDVIRRQPEDSGFDEIFRELVFHRMVDHGLEDARHGRVLNHQMMGRRIRKWHV